MKTRFLILIWLAAACLSARAMEPMVIIKSPDEGESFIYGAVANRKLQWNEKESKLYAIVSVDNSRYSTAGDRTTTETLKFYLPGVERDEAKKLYFVRGKNGEIIPFAEAKKELFFNAIKPVSNAVVRVIRTRGKIQIVAEIYRPEDVRAEEAKQKSEDTNEWQKLDLDKALGN